MLQQELPRGKWFCCSDCNRIHSTLQKLLVAGAEKLPDSHLDIIKKKHEEKGLDTTNGFDVRWRLISGKIASPESRVLLSKAVAIFHVSTCLFNFTNFEIIYIWFLIFENNVYLLSHHCSDRLLIAIRNFLAIFDWHFLLFICSGMLWSYNWFRIWTWPYSCHGLWVNFEIYFPGTWVSEVKSFAFLYHVFLK